MRAPTSRSVLRVLLLCSALAVAWITTGSAQTYAPAEVLVRFKSDATASCRDSAIASVSGTVVDSLTTIRVYKLQLADSSVIAAIATLQTRWCIEFAQFNMLAPHDSAVTLAPPNDAYFDSLTYLRNTGQHAGTSGADIHAEEGWSFISESPDVIIGIMDSGVDYLYQSDLASNLWVNTGEDVANNDGDDNDGNGFIDDRNGWNFFHDNNDPWSNCTHGTAVAGVAAARGNNSIGITGVTWRAKIMPIKVLSSSCAFKDDYSVAAGVNYAVNNGAKILNISLRFERGWLNGATLFQAACDAASAQGVLIVCGAGNRYENQDVRQMVPVSFPTAGLISVAATDQNDVLAYECDIEEMAFKSAYGATTVDLAAPGCALFNLWPSDAYNGYHSGTSLSSPMVAGAAALLWAQNPSWTNLQVKSRLMTTIDTLASCVGKMVAPGRLNLGRALDNVPPSTVSDLTVESVGRYSQSISWTDTGDDATSGQGRAYKLKRWTSPITTTAQFDNNATLVAAGTPGTAGTVHCIDVDGLSSCTTYYWALRIEDNAFNVSSLNSSVSASTFCSGSSASICPEWFLAEGGEGGGGGGGGSALTVPFEAASYGMGRATVGLRPTLASAEERYGWIAENSLQLGSPEPASGDLLEMRSLKPNANGDYRVRLLALGSEGVDLSSVALGVVDQEAGSVAVAAGSSVYTGQPRALASGVVWQGEDVSATYSGGGAAQSQGDALTITLPAEGGSRVLAMELSGLPTDADHASGGVDVQTRDQGGEWASVTTLIPRRQAQTAAVFVGNAREVRLVASRPVHIKSLREIVGATVAEPTWLDLRSMAGSGTEGEDGSATLGQSEDLDLLFAGSDAAEGTRRSAFLRVTAQAGSGLRASTSGVSGNLSFSLGSMRPNPAPGRVTIDYVMAHEASVAIRVYNVAGRLVRNLASGLQPAGARSVVWDGRDYTGSAAGKGVYFVRMDVPGWTNQRKMILLSDR